MFDVGFFELLVIGLVALIVLGPQRLPRAARMAGLWVRKARAQWYSVKAEFEREMAAEDMRRSIGEPARALREEVDLAGRELKQSLDESLPEAGPERPAAPPAPDTAASGTNASTDDDHDDDTGTPPPRQEPPAP